MAILKYYPNVISRNLSLNDLLVQKLMLTEVWMLTLFILFKVMCKIMDNGDQPEHGIMEMNILIELWTLGKMEI